MKIQKLDKSTSTPEEYFLEADKLITGNPKQIVWMSYTDPSNQFFVGTWSSEAGKWKISYTEEEYCELLEGESVITDESGFAVTVKTGDRFIVPRGFVGTWEVVEPSKKTFVIFEKAN